MQINYIKKKRFLIKKNVAIYIAIHFKISQYTGTQNLSSISSPNYSIKLMLLYILFLRWAIWPMDFIFFFTNLVNCRLNNCIWVFWIMHVHYAYTVYIWKAIWIKLYVLIFLSFCTRAKKCNYNARAIKVEQCMCWGPDWDCFCVLFN